MIQLKNLKTYMPYIIICGLFAITLVSCVVIYFKYTSELSNAEKQNEAMSLEVKLPVIEWGKYKSLSKKYINGRIAQ